MALHPCLQNFSQARLGQRFLHNLSAGVESCLAAWNLATTQLIAVTEVMLCDGH